MPTYADVILPLPLYSSFTYEIPESLLSSISVGSRVLVPFGKKGLYTGIVEATHLATPKSQGEIKEISALLDTEPVIRHPQLKLWQWISQYYLCSPGEVMKAALPSALKVESESWVSCSQDTAPEDILSLTQRQAELYAYVSHAERVRISDLDKQFTYSSLRLDINRLISRGVLQISERVVDKYTSRRVSYVSICCERGDEQALHSFFAAVKRSAQQEKLLIAYLDLSDFLHKEHPIKEVERKALLDKCGVSTAVLSAMVKKGIFKVQECRVNRFSSPLSALRSPLSQMPTLSEPQSLAIRNIRRSMGEHLVTLLHGVTGSGKTEIYTHLINDALQHGDHVLMLVPEISLTTQLTTRLQQFFADRMLVYHSKFSDSERVDIWQKLLTASKPMLILGVRSSVFLPFPRLGLVIVDEEHESSYKQYDPAPRYNARDTAIMLASMHGAKVLLGSATPAIDTYYKAKTGKYGLVELLTRYSDIPLPQVDIVDMRMMRKRKEVSGPFSSVLLSSLQHTLQGGRQAIMFQNRRGFAPVVSCNVCGWTPKCPNCDISLVYHKREHTLKCHYCGHMAALPTICPACESNALSTYGYGTERLAEMLHERFPEVSMTRMDLDTTRAKDAYQKIIEDFSQGKSQVLIGTQMVTKGLDFSNVQLVGVINADTLTHFPDFRSNERAYATLEQVAGRAGRREGSGSVLIQTTDPEHPAITYAKAHDYAGFYAQELEQRRSFVYPPFSRIINIQLRHKDEATLSHLCDEYAKVLRQYFGTRVLGPDTPSISRIANMYIRTLMLKVETEAYMPKVKELLRQIYNMVADLPGMKALRLSYDVDPA